MEEAIITTSWDDGHPLDLKLAELLRRYDIPATFYIPIDNVERVCMGAGEIREVGASFDIGAHTYHHRNLRRLSSEEAEREIVEGKKGLEEIIGREMKAFCYPMGNFNDVIIDMVKRAGFIGARTTKLFTSKVKNPYEIGTTITARDYRSTFYARQSRHSLKSRDYGLFFFTLKKRLLLRCWERIAIETLKYVMKNGGVWHLYGHSWEIEENDDWERLTSVLIEIKELAQGARKVSNSELMERCAGKV